MPGRGRSWARSSRVVNLARDPRPPKGFVGRRLPRRPGPREVKRPSWRSTRGRRPLMLGFRGSSRPGRSPGPGSSAMDGPLAETEWPERLRSPLNTSPISFDADGTIHPKDRETRSHDPPVLNLAGPRRRGREPQGRPFVGARSGALPFQLWKHPDELPRALVLAGEHLAQGRGRVALTMTAELCDCYPTKAVGVRSVLDAVIGRFSRGSDRSSGVSMAGSTPGGEEIREDSGQLAAASQLAGAGDPGRPG